MGFFPGRPKPMRWRIPPSWTASGRAAISSRSSAGTKRAGRRRSIAGDVKGDLRRRSGDRPEGVRQLAAREAARALLNQLGQRMDQLQKQLAEDQRKKADFELAQLKVKDTWRPFDHAGKGGGRFDRCGRKAKNAGPGADRRGRDSAQADRRRRRRQTIGRQTCRCESGACRGTTCPQRNFAQRS